MGSIIAEATRPSPILKIVQAQPNHILESALERLRMTEALTARDNAVRQMEALCASNRSKDSAIAKLEQEKAELNEKLAGTAVSSPLASGAAMVDSDGQMAQEVKDRYRKLEQENENLKSKVTLLMQQHEGSQSPANSLMSPRDLAPIHTSPLLEEEFRSPPINVYSPLFSNPPEFSVLQEAEAVTKARYAVLADLPIPPEMPTDMLVPIVIPSPYTLQDFIGTASGNLKVQLANYRIFQENTTFWCPEQEEHGYFVTPVFKCNTNPRVTTAHRWTTLDLASGFNKSTECFYNKEGKWYYAGVYKTFRLRDITPEEWTQLPAPTTQALVKETLSLRKNTSPQNVYETGQLYAAGALKAACIGLQCIGFNEDLYKGLLALASTCSKTGRWRAPPTGLGTGPPPTVWSATNSPSLGFEAVNSPFGFEDKDTRIVHIEQILSPQL